MRWRSCIILALGAVLAAAVLPASTTRADDSGNDFSLQVMTTPLFADIKPGQTAEMELKIRNAGPRTEQLKLYPRGFSYDSNTGKIQISKTAPKEIADGVSFDNPTFTVLSGQIAVIKVHFTPPKQAESSYSFVLMVSRQAEAEGQLTGAVMQGTLAVFTLVNIDGPNAVRKLDLDKFESDRFTYEYLPASLNIRFKNTGNTIIRPSGNIFIQRGAGDKTPIETIPVNPKRSYVLPGTSRVLSSAWDSGFPVYKNITEDTGVVKRVLAFSESLTDFRYGRYTAKLVAVYNDGHGDIPVEDEVTFWVIPWKPLLALLALVLIVVDWFLIRTNSVKNIHKHIRRIRKKTAAPGDTRDDR